MTKPDEYRLLNNLRFYVLCFSFLLSIAVICYLRINIVSTQLFYIRTQQVFGLLSIIYWYVALIISPLGYVVGKARTKRLVFARRAIGVSAFYFALLHAGIALWGQLGGLGNIGILPSLFKWSLLGGLIALIVLLLLAATSLDTIINFMTLRWWKWLHRLIYIGGVFVILHIWTIGTHLAYTNLQIASFVALAILSGLEILRISINLNKKYLDSQAQTVAVFVGLWAVVLGLLLMMPTAVNNYHSRHNGSHNESTEAKR